MFGTITLALKLAAAEARAGELAAALARSQANFDWLAAHVNELKVERAALLERLIGLQIAAVPMIARTPIATPLPGADPAYAGPRLDLGDVLSQAREIADTKRRGTPPEGAPLPDAVSFEDMGDDAAHAAGLRHADDGTVVFGR